MASSNNISQVSPHENMNKNATQKDPLKLKHINIKLLSETALLSSFELFSSSTNEKPTTTYSKLTNSKSLISLATTIRIDPSLNELKEMVGTTHKNEMTANCVTDSAPKIKRDISMPLLCPEDDEGEDEDEDERKKINLQKKRIEDNFEIKEFCKSVTEIQNDANFNKGAQQQQLPLQQQQQQTQKKKTKRSALAWVGRTVGKRVVKKQPKSAFIHTYNNHDNTPIATSTRNSIRNNLNTSCTSPQPTSTTLPKLKSNKIDWTDHAKQGTHFWLDVSIPQSNNDPCYLTEPDALEFHQLVNSCQQQQQQQQILKCQASQKSEAKKKCLICKIVVHESCTDLLQLNVKCRTTYREAVNKKKSLKDNQCVNVNNPNNNNKTIVNMHHWVYHKFKEEYFENKCQACLKSYTNRFGLQVSRTIVGCTWCKIAYHLKCFTEDELRVECTFGDHNQLMVPPSWIVKSSNKNSLRSQNMIKPYDRRSSKRLHLQEQTVLFDNNNNNENINTSTTQSTTKSSLLLPLNATMTSLGNSAQPNSSLKHSNHSFIVRPPSSALAALNKPLLVLINPKSGGKLGQKILKKFTWLLNPRQVFDLTLPGCPKFPLYLYRNVPNLRIIVGGGDGTVGWVLSVIDQIKFIGARPSVAVLPLGTGNDLARTLNWGSGYTDESLSKILLKVTESHAVKLDRWKILTRPNLSVDLNTLDADDTSAINKLKNDEMNNYFSIGADAHVVLEFHERREANPHKFSTRWYNFLQYGQYGSRDQIKKTWRNLSDFVQLECDSKNYTDVIRSRGYHCIIFLNIPSYSSGTNPWGNHHQTSSSSSSSENSNFSVQSMSDGRIEVIGCFTSTLPKIVIGGAGERICQATHIKLTTSTYIPIQIDGEPAKLCPSIIEITLKNQAIMLEHVKYNTDSPILGYHSNIQKSFEVKCILMEDFELYRKDSNILATKAIYIGAICTANTTESLLQIRNTINLLISNCANGFSTDKWSFLNGEEFYRISDDSDECLLDIVSSGEVIFILDENPKFTNKSYNSNLNLTKNNETSSNKVKAQLQKTSNDNDNYDDKIFANSFQMQKINNTNDDSIPVVVVNSANQIGAFPCQNKMISFSQSSELN